MDENIMRKEVKRIYFKFLGPEVIRKMFSEYFNVGELFPRPEIGKKVKSFLLEKDFTWEFFPNYFNNSVTVYPDGNIEIECLFDEIDKINKVIDSLGFIPEDYKLNYEIK
jgi:hypothetical protein